MNDDGVVRLEMSTDELELVRTALRLLLSTLGREEAEELEDVRVVAGQDRHGGPRMTQVASVDPAAPTDVPTFRHFIAGEWCDRPPAPRSRAAIRPTTAT